MEPVALLKTNFSRRSQCDVSKHENLVPFQQIERPHLLASSDLVSIRSYSDSESPDQNMFWLTTNVFVKI